MVERGLRRKPSADLIFIVGAPRSGTTMTRDILNRHPSVHLCNEVHFGERVLDVVGSRKATTLSGFARAARLTVDAYRWSFLSTDPLWKAETLREKACVEGGGLADLLGVALSEEARRHGAHRGGDSSPQDILYLDTLASWYPHARFVALARDPRAYLASYKNYHRKKISTHRRRYDPVASGMLWRSYMNRVLAARGRLDEERFMVVRYEDLVRDPDTQVQRLCAFLGLDFRRDLLNVDRQNSSYFAVEQDLSSHGITTSSLEKWRSALSESEVWIIERVANRPMRELGYDLESKRLGPRGLLDLATHALRAPVRIRNLLFGTGKPFTWKRLRRALSSLGS